MLEERRSLSIAVDQLSVHIAAGKIHFSLNFFERLVQARPPLLEDEVQHALGGAFEVVLLRLSGKEQQGLGRLVGGFHQILNIFRLLLESGRCFFQRVRSREGRIRKRVVLAGQIHKALVPGVRHLFSLRACVGNDFHKIPHHDRQGLRRLARVCVAHPLRRGFHVGLCVYRLRVQPVDLGIHQLASLVKNAEKIVIGSQRLRLHLTNRARQDTQASHKAVAAIRSGLGVSVDGLLETRELGPGKGEATKVLNHSVKRRGSRVIKRLHNRHHL